MRRINNMKNFKQVSEGCPWQYTGIAIGTYVCIAKKGIPDRPFKEIECAERNCAICHFLGKGIL
jgi:hypothetical protein